MAKTKTRPRVPAGHRPLGVAEVADLLGVKRRTVHVWQERGILPARDFTVNGLPAWMTATIKGWARKTGRL